jgi:hypothetical protein
MIFRDKAQPIAEVRPEWAHYGVYAHLCADTMEELHQVAKSIGLRREWFQDATSYPHYDLLGRAAIARADRLGVHVLERKEFFWRLRAARDVRKFASGEEVAVLHAHLEPRHGLHAGRCGVRQLLEQGDRGAFPAGARGLGRHGVCGVQGHRVPGGVQGVRADWP